MRDHTALTMYEAVNGSALSSIIGESPDRPITIVHRGRDAADLTHATSYLLVESSDPAPSRNDLVQMAAEHLRSPAPRIWQIHRPLPSYRERVTADEANELICVRREYGCPVLDTAPIILTSERQIAQQWARARSDRQARRQLQRAINQGSGSVSQMPRCLRQWIGPFPAKRLFDIAFSVIALLLTAPLYPIVMLAIWLEDGAPVFFVHRRQSIGGQEFGCIKFRVMRRDAERIKALLGSRNRSDGPQFHLPDDPRLLKVGRFLRRWNIDELPQFLNVLIGDMSIVGPRPSPDNENQFCPAWREARLSVRPGLTGLWQVCRTRKPNTDFQEWIRYDLEYVQRQSWILDLWIIAMTPLAMLRRPA
ncbi:MAG: sugar transferase [Phycisphaerales bacterium]